VICLTVLEWNGMNERDLLIAPRAYAHWLRMGRPNNTELQDWLHAEAELKRYGCLPSWDVDGALGSGSQLLEVLLNHTAAGVFVKDIQGRYMLVNPPCETIFGAADDICGKTNHELFPSSFADASRQSELRVLATCQPEQFEEFVPRADAVQAVLTWKIPLCDPRGQPYALCGIATTRTSYQQAAFRLAAEHAVTRVLAESYSLVEAAPGILRAICHAQGWDVGVLWTVDSLRQVLRCVDVWHAPAVQVPRFEAISREITYTRGVGLPGRIWQTGAPNWIDDVVLDPNFPRAPAALADNLHSAWGFPLQDRGAILGVLEFFSRRIHQPDQELLEMCGSIGTQIAQFVERRQTEKSLHQRERELSVARAIQQHRLPRVVPILPGVTCYGRSQPTQEDRR
jgi:PAS domain S-box-containing protein